MSTPPFAILRSMLLSGVNAERFNDPHPFYSASGKLVARLA